MIESSPYPYIIIVGTGSSGTRYTARLFERGGVKVAHEQLGADGVSSFYISLGHNFFRPPHGGPTYGVIMDLLRKVNRRHVIIHQTRDPLKTISTFQRSSPKTWLFITRHVPHITREMPIVERCMNYWLYWNLCAEIIADWHCKVEDIDSRFKEWCDVIERPKLYHMRRFMFELPRTVNTRVGYYSPLSWDILWQTDPHLTKQIIQKGRQYGYSIDFPIADVSWLSHNNREECHSPLCVWCNDDGLH